VHDLPDGSIVQLNADSKLEYNKLLWLVNRNVSLKGEAYFDAEKGKKFTVFSERGQTQVLGTGFNVYSRNQDYKVECIEGSVKVSCIGSRDDIVLLAGDGVHFGTSDQVMLYNFSVEDRNDWRKGEFYFNNESLNSVFETLSRQFDIDLQFNRDINNIKYTGYFNDKNLENALKLICDPVDLSYHIKDGYVVIE
jgi:ferric-dicitrate binding protein FerR (iron transport regulator)